MSDQAPPHGTPDHRILKAPGLQAASTQEGASRSAPAQPQTSSYGPDNAYCKETREYEVFIKAGGGLLHNGGMEKGLPVSEEYRAQLLREIRVELEKNCKTYPANTKNKR